MLDQAIALHRQGRLAEAEEAYRAILSREPENAAVGHLLGLLALDAGLPQQAIPVFERVRMLAPDNAVYRVNLGQAYLLCGRAAEALTAFDRAIVLDPLLFDAHFQRGQALKALARWDEAVDAFTRAAEITPGVAAWNNRALALVELGRFEEALADFERALAADPDNPMAQSNCGFALTRLGRHEEAIAVFQKAAALAPGDAGPHYNLGEPLRFLGRMDEALAAYDRAIALKPDMANAHVNRGLVLTHLGRTAEALASFDRAIALEPDSIGAHMGRSNALEAAGRIDEALAYDRDLARDPRFRAEADFHAAGILLARGQWEEGWKRYEARRALPHRADARRYPQPEWLGGSPLAGKTLYVYGEQGLGDHFQFARYLALARQAGAKVVFSPKDRLAALFRAQPHLADAVLPWQSAPSAFDLHIPLASMPLAFGTRPDTVPADSPYLHAEASRVEAWRGRIGGQGFKIGICWAGSPDPLLGPDRSFPLAQLAGLAALPGVRLISLQKEDGLEQLAGLPAGMAVETLGEDFDAGADAFCDTAAVMASLDLVITCDTAVAHLAGALGVPVWTALKRRAEWRWMEGETSPWYPSMTLFRQAEAGAWAPVFAAMRERLSARLDKA